MSRIFATVVIVLTLLAATMRSVGAQDASPAASPAAAP
jgi:Na+-transporting methylmalonyl-CoA/oxaloacetate decarboxylase gamma subunit